MSNFDYATLCVCNAGLLSNLHENGKIRLACETRLSAANEVRRGVNAVKSRSDKPKKQRCRSRDRRARSSVRGPQSVNRCQEQC